MINWFNLINWFKLNNKKRCRAAAPKALGDTSVPKRSEGTEQPKLNVSNLINPKLNRKVGLNVSNLINLKLNRKVGLNVSNLINWIKCK